MIQDIAPHKLNNEFKADSVVQPESPVVCFWYKDVLLRQSNTEAAEDFALAEAVSPVGDLSFLPTYAELPEDTEVTFLFTYDGVDLFTCRLSVPENGRNEPGLDYNSGAPTYVVNSNHNGKTMEGFSFASIKDIRQLVLLEKHQVFLLMTALQVNNWYVDNRYCGRCATRTVHSPRERALVCPNCHRTIYPRILPAVIVAVTCNGKILLTKYSPKTGHAFPYYALVAGFTEIGETLEECVQREVMEETGICVKNIRYYKSQPWGVVDDLLMGFFCEADLESQEAMLKAAESGSEGLPPAFIAKLSKNSDYWLLDENGDPKVRLDQDELRTGVWLTPEEMTLQPDAYSLTNEMMLLFKSKSIHCPDELPLDMTRADIEALEKEFYK